MLPDWIPQTILIEGTAFNYYRSPGGKTSGKPPLVLMHGFSDNGLCWEPVAAELMDQYDILMPDARGHGLSARVQRGEKFDQAADLAGVMLGLGITSAVVAGHSMGAAIASQLGARYPHLVRALILEDPPWFLPRPGVEINRQPFEKSPLGQWMLSLQEQTFEQVLAQCRIDHPTWPDVYARAWCQGKKQLDPNFMSGELSMGDWQDIVPRIACPVLVFTADPVLGGIVTPELAQKVIDLNPQIRVFNIPEVGHHVRFANHALYMQAFKSFLAQL